VRVRVNRSAIVTSVRASSTGTARLGWRDRSVPGSKAGCQEGSGSSGWSSAGDFARAAAASASSFELGSLGLSAEFGSACSRGSAVRVSLLMRPSSTWTARPGERRDRVETLQGRTRPSTSFEVHSLSTRRPRPIQPSVMHNLAYPPQMGRSPTTRGLMTDHRAGSCCELEVQTFSGPRYCRVRVGCAWWRRPWARAIPVSTTTAPAGSFQVTRSPSRTTPTTPATSGVR